jgi:hypothetical protein
VTPATITVTGAGDTSAVDGVVTLREAIQSINAGSNVNADVVATGAYGTNDTIRFNITAAGTLQTINVTSALPTLTRPVLIDGYSEPGARANSQAAGSNAMLLIELNGAGAGAGVDGLTVNITGASATANATIQGLVINRFTGNGIHLLSGFNTVAGNLVGTNAMGTAASGNGVDGIRVESANNTIGGTTPATRNVASGNVTDGIHVLGAAATNNLVANNYVGVTIGGNAIVTTTGVFGIEVTGAANNTIGGLTVGARNVVGGNAAGIELDNGAQNNLVQGNFAGVGGDGLTGVGNRLHGIVLRGPMVQNNTVGGTAAGAGNTVAFNGTGGVAVFGDGSLPPANPQNTGNALLGNSIFLNGRSNPSMLLGIDLVSLRAFPVDDGVTPNHTGTAVGPNNLQNFPVLTLATPTTGGTAIAGTLNSTASTTFRVELFASPMASGTGFGEGQTFLGFTSVTTDASGNASFTTTVMTSVPVGQVITATATDPGNNTSEFSQAITVASPVASPVAVNGFEQSMVNAPVATFTFSGNPPATQFTASIDWGDGTAATTGTVTLSGSTYTVQGTHTYTEESTFSVTVTVTAAGSPTTIRTSASILEELLPDGTRGTANQRYVSELYRNLLGRRVEAGGLAYWTGLLNGGASRIAIAQGIQSSPEFRAVEVQALFQRYLKRAADPVGLSVFTGMLAGGATFEQVAAQIAGSPEYLRTQAGGSTSGFLDAFYRDTFNRAVDPLGRSFGNGLLAAGSTTAQVATALYNSDEYRTVVVRGIFQQNLDRALDTVGQQVWTAQLRAGVTDEMVQAMILGDPGGEFYNQTAS